MEELTKKKEWCWLVNPAAGGEASETRQGKEGAADKNKKNKMRRHRGTPASRALGLKPDGWPSSVSGNRLAEGGPRGGC